MQTVVQTSVYTRIYLFAERFEYVLFNTLRNAATYSPKVFEFVLNNSYKIDCPVERQMHLEMRRRKCLQTVLQNECGHPCVRLNLKNFIIATELTQFHK